MHSKDSNAVINAVLLQPCLGSIWKQNASAMFEFCENVKITSSLAFNKMIIKQINQFFASIFGCKCSLAALQAATILVAMASEKKKWRLNYRRKSPFGDQRI